MSATMDTDRILTIDAEANGLTGQAFCVAMNVTQSHVGVVHEIDSVVFRCPIEGPVDQWVQDNVMPGLAGVDVDCANYGELMGKVRQWQEQWTVLGVRTLTHVPWPVEARLLSDMYPGVDIWSGPYPLLDVAPLLLVAGYDPVSVDVYLRENNVAAPQGLTPHHPLYDVRAAAAAWWHLNERLAPRRQEVG